MMNVPSCLILIFIEGMLDFARHECFRVLLENPQAGAGAKVNLLSAMDSAWVLRRVLQFSAAGRLIFRRLSSSDFCQVSIFLVMRIVIDVPCAEGKHSHGNTNHACQK